MGLEACDAVDEWLECIFAHFEPGFLWFMLDDGGGFGGVCDYVEEVRVVLFLVCVDVVRF